MISCGIQEIHRDISSDSPNTGSLHFDRSITTHSGSATYYKMIPIDSRGFFLFCIWLILERFLFMFQIDIFVQVLQADGGKNLYMEIQLCRWVIILLSNEYEWKIVCDCYYSSGTRSACINAASLALADAGIPMRDLATSCSAGYLNRTPLIGK